MCEETTRRRALVGYRAVPDGLNLSIGYVMVFIVKNLDASGETP